VYVGVADPAVLNINHNIVIAGLSSFKRVKSERRFGLLSSISLDFHIFPK
jgi:hypothetical protein